MSLLVEDISKVKTLWCPDSGIVVEQTWFDDHGCVHCFGDPAKIFRDRYTGKTTREEFWFRNRLHNTIGPAILEYDKLSGECTYRAWVIADELFREGDLPAVEHIAPHTGIVIREEYYDDKLLGLLDRESGPAVIVRDPESGEITHAEFYLQGVKQKPDVGQTCDM